MKALSFASVLLVLTVGFLWCASPVSAKTAFVSPTGSNTTGNGTIGNPWQTLKFAMDSIYPGDALLLRAGTYAEQFTSVRSGTPGAYITVAAYNDEAAVIDGIGGVFNNGVIIDHSYLKLRGFTVKTWLHTGIWLRDCQFVEMRNLNVTAVNGGIALTGTVHDFIVDSCTIYDYYGGAGGSGFDATPYGTDSIYNGVISNSKAFLTAGAFDNCDGFALGHEGIGNIRFYNCEVSSVGDGFDISGTGIVLERCSAHGCTYGGGYKLWRESVTMINCIGYDNSTNVELDFDFPTSKGVKARLINCTLFGCRNANVMVENSAGGSTLQLYNCILAAGDNTGLTFDGDSIKCYTGDYNLFHMNNTGRTITTSQLDFSLTQVENGEWTSHSGQDAHSRVVADVQTVFQDTLAIHPDLHLKAGALAINNGTLVPGAPTVDFDNHLRNVGQIDIGAYEFGASGTSGMSDEYMGQPSAYGLEQNYPNPFNPTTTVRFTIGGVVAPSGNYPERSEGGLAAAHVRLSVYDMLGREVAVLVNENKPPGYYEVKWNAANHASGIYLYRLVAGDYVESRKMMLLK